MVSAGKFPVETVPSCKASAIFRIIIMLDRIDCSDCRPTQLNLLAQWEHSFIELFTAKVLHTPEL